MLETEYSTPQKNVKSQQRDARPREDSQYSTPQKNVKSQPTRGTE